MGYMLMMIMLDLLSGMALRFTRAKGGGRGGLRRWHGWAWID